MPKVNPIEVAMDDLDDFLDDQPEGFVVGTRGDQVTLIAYANRKVEFSIELGPDMAEAIGRCMIDHAREARRRG